MVDKVRPLKLENPSLGGTETDGFPTEADASEDYLSAKGIAFEGLDTFRIEKLGRVLQALTPDETRKPTYLVNGDLSIVEYFNSATQINANRIARMDVSYTGNDLTSEVWKFYETDGTTVLRTVTYTYTYTANDLTNVTKVTT